MLVAVTVTVVCALTVGAVNNPEAVMVPAEAFQYTALLVAPVTVAVNCWVAPELRLADDGETVTTVTAEA